MQAPAAESGSSGTSNRPFGRDGLCAVPNWIRLRASLIYLGRQVFPPVPSRSDLSEAERIDLAAQPGPAGCRFARFIQPRRRALGPG